MISRSREEEVIFKHPFELKGIGRTLPAGQYKVVTDEELIEELSFPVYRRTATMIYVPGEILPATSIEMVTIDPGDLRVALIIDRSK